MIPLYTEEEFEKARSRQKLALQCKHCGKMFLKPKNSIQSVNILGTLEFCSPHCANSRNPPSTLKCEQCGEEFIKLQSQIKKSKHHFCSRSCSATWNNQHKTKGTRISKLEKWLQSKLPLLYPNLEFHFNRSDAINGELDIYIPSLKLAFELNGIFHYEPIFTKEKLEKTQNNDRRKMQACLEQSIELCIIDVSKHKYFKEQTSAQFLEIIKNIVSLKLSRIIDPIEETT